MHYDVLRTGDHKSKCATAVVQLVPNLNGCGTTKIIMKKVYDWCWQHKLPPLSKAQG